jgi:hypothetical protein
MSVGGTHCIASDQVSPATVRSGWGSSRVSTANPAGQAGEQAGERDHPSGSARPSATDHGGGVTSHQPRRRIGSPPVGSSITNAGCGNENTNGTIGAQHPVDLAEHPVDVVHRGQPVGRHRGVDGVGPHEGQLGQRAVVGLDPHALPFGPVAGLGEVGRLVVHGDDPGTGLGQRHRARPGAAAEVQEAAAGHLAEQPELALGGSPGP